ncbi:hypothetical protein HYC85_017592 [Camellia sinensis]|uniref:TPX2 C-terminal domain-containing protein n=1 Tax=Camellia sinensis TaxID=4442 RepID=A0A7J7GTJ0_CAMSI|nr:hypothetical protein HYC85_017592 [Camellia sinensis]
MEFTNNFSVLGVGVVLENVDGAPASGSAIARPNRNPETGDKLEDGATNSNTEAIPDRPTARAESNGLMVSKELGEKETDHSKGLKPQKGQGKAKIEKLSSPKHAGATWVKKSKDGKDMETTSAHSNGSLASNSCPKQPFALRTMGRSFNDREVIDSNSKPRPALINARIPKQSGKSDAAPFTVNETQPEGLMEKEKLKPLKKGQPNKAEGGSSESSLSPTTGDAKPRKVGTLPSYNINFKCDERAEKRREFYSKLEEKIHAKEVEKSNLQAKTQQHPMPSFYQEPPPPKPELKKIPPTRAKSPKLGRKKSSPTRDTEGNTSRSYRSGRLSFDEKLSQNNVTKVPPAHLKKPQRKSLPKLPSEKTILTNKGNEASSHKTTLPKETSEDREPEAAPSVEPGHTQPNMDDVPVVEDQAQTILVQEPIALEN